MNKTKIREINLYLAILFVFFFIPCSFAIPQTFNIHGKLTDSNGANLYGTYNMTFRIYDAFTGGIPLWQSINQSVSTDSEGVYTVVLKNINLTFSEQYYIGVAVQSDAEMTPRINLTSSGYSFRTNVSDYLESSRNYEMANLTLTQKITFALGEIIDNIVGGWVRITGGLNVSENVTASYFIGDGSRLTNVNGSGLYVPYTGATSNVDLGSNNFLINNSVFFVNSTSGNVGIGTTVPRGTFDVGGVAGSAGMLINSDSYISLSNNDAGTSNTIFGKKAGLSLDVGSNYNTFIGENVADAAMSDAVNNVGIGYNALSGITIGDSNTAIGYSALSYTDDGYRNVAVGDKTLASGEAVGRNIAIGYEALFYQKNGLDTVAIGYQAGRGASGKSNNRNVFIGALAGNSIQSGNDNIIIGYDQDLPGVDDSFHLNIGGLIYGDLANGNVGIGTDSPTSALTINGDIESTGDAKIIAGSDNFYIYNAAKDKSMRLNIGGGGYLQWQTNSDTPMSFSSKQHLVFTVDSDEDEANSYIGFNKNGSLGANGDLMRIEEGGNVGIGTTTPSGKLEIDGGNLVMTGTVANHLLLPLNNDATTPTLAFGDGDTGFYESADDDLSIAISGNKRWHISNTVIRGSSTGNPGLRWEIASAVNPTMNPNHIDTNTGIGRAGADQLSLIAGGVEGIRVNTAASGVNYLNITPSATTDAVQIGTAGTDTNIDLALMPKGSGNVGIGTDVIQNKLHIHDSTGGSGAAVRFSNSDSGSGAGDGFKLGMNADEEATFTNFENTLTQINLYGGGDFAIVDTSHSPDDQLLYITNAGNVGIGTTTPGFKLEIKDDGGINNMLKFIASDGNTLSYIQNDGSGNVVQNFYADGNVLKAKINTVGDSYFNGGNIGIGTTTPTTKLDVNGTITATTLNITGTSYLGDIVIQSDNITVNNIISKDGNISFFNSTGSEKVRILENGNVGIGVVSPTSKLHLPLENDAATPTISFGDGDTGFYERTDDSISIALGGNRIYSIWDGGIQDTNRAYGFLLREEGTSATNPVFTFGNDDDTGIGRGGADILSLIAGGTNGLNVISGGNIGIGTTTPTTKLDVNGTITATTLNITGTSYLGDTVIQSDNITVNNIISKDGNIRFFNSTGSEKVRILENGNVGIGTVAPNSKLEVGSGQLAIQGGTEGAPGLAFVGDLDTGIESYMGNRLAFTAGGTRALIFSSAWFQTFAQFQAMQGTAVAPGYSFRNDEGTGIFSTMTENYIGFTTNGTEKMRITSDGNVGIGTTSPTAKLEIAQSTDGSHELNVSDVLYVNATSGKVGIGTAAPSGILNIESKNGSKNGIVELFSNVDANITSSLEEPRLRMYGWDVTPGSQSIWDMYIQSDGGLSYSHSGGGASTVVYSSANLKLPDESKLSFGNAPDFSIGYSNGEDYLQFVDGATLGSNVRMVIDSTGNVGIGTTNPSVKLEVAGGIKSTDGYGFYTAETGAGYWSNEIGTRYSGMAFSENGAGLTFRTNNIGHRLVITSTGNVGIGTVEPGQALEVAGAVKATGAFVGETSVSSAYFDFNAGQARITAKGADGSIMGGFKMLQQASDGSPANAAIEVQADGDVLLAQTSGNVGIGTTEPNDKLDVLGGNIRLSTANSYIKFVGDGYIMLDTTGAGSKQLNIVNQDNTTKYFFREDGTAYLSGNVGIGTTTPNAKVEIAKSTDGSHELNVSDVLYVNASSGNVGIGTDAPDAKLQIVGGNLYVGKNADQDTRLRLYSDTSGAYVSIENYGTYGGFFFNEISNMLFQTNKDNSGYITFKTRTSGTGYERMRIANSGNVGIGTTTPTTKLDVNGTITATTLNITGTSYLGDTVMQSDNITVNNIISKDGNIRFFNSTGSEKVRILENGNVGIGTDSPSQKLDINGAIKTSDKLILDSDNDTYITSDSLDDYMRFYLGGADMLQFYDVGGVKTVGFNPVGAAYDFDINWDSGSAFWVDGATGNVGIGTTTPTAKLEIAKSTDGSHELNVSDVLYVNATSGNVGIGTDSLSYKLQINQSADNNGLRIYGYDDRSANYGELGVLSSGRFFINTNVQTEFQVDGTNTFHVNYNGLILPLDRLWMKFGTDADYSIGYSDSIDSFMIGAGSGLTTPRLVVNNLGSVGIGTTTPTTKLDVNGTITATTLNITGTSYLGDTVIQSDNITVNNIISKDGNISFFNSIGSEKVRILENGNVGIGTDAPDVALEVVGKITSDSWITANSNVYVKSPDTTKSMRMYQSDGASNINAEDTNLVLYSANGSIKLYPSSYSWITSAAGQPMYFDAGGVYSFRDVDDSNAVRATINSATGGANFGLNSGNVGIGTTTPTAKLDINASGAALNIQNTMGSSKFFVNTSSGNVGIGTDSPNNPFVIYGGNARYQLANSATGIGEYDGFTLALGGTDAYIIQRENANMYFRTHDNLRAVIDNTGNVGIGTTYPTTKLDVNGTITATTLNITGTSYLGDTVIQSDNITVNNIISKDGNISFFNSTGSEKVRILENGNVGIGMAYVANTWKLDVDGKIRGDYFAFTNGEGSNPGYTTPVMYSPASGEFAIAANSEERLRIDNSGNVGIGTTTPTAKLEINASGAAFDVQNTTGSSKFFVNASSGNVGIGTDSPDYSLTINQKKDADGFRVYGYDDHSSDRGSFFVNEFGTFVFEGSDELKIQSLVGSIDIYTPGTHNVRLQRVGTGNVQMVEGGGNVGIGTTTPNAKLEIAKSTDGSHELNVSDVLYVNASSGNVGIGTTPNTPLHVAGSGNVVHLTDSVSSNDLFYMVGVDDDAILKMYADGNTKNIEVKATGDSYFNGGNVGIGTTAPNSLLHVNATGNAYVQLDVNNTALASTDCDAEEERGRMIVDGSSNTLWVCFGASGWVAK